MSKSLLKLLPKIPFTYGEAMKKGFNINMLTKLIKEQKVERIERGIYRISNFDFTEEEQFIAATKKVQSKSAVTMLSALSYYDLTDIIPKQVWLMVESQKRTQNKSIKLYRSTNPHWNIGIIKEKGFCIVSIERAIVDSLTHKPIFPIRIGIEALKEAVRTKKVTLSKVVDMANKLGVREKIDPYIEVLI